jgi:uncharacterized protein (UPF0335 family)
MSKNDDNTGTATRFAKEQLRSIIERIERLEEEKKTIADDIRDVYAEAKGNGFDVKALRTIVRLRKQDANERAEQETILETYMQALGMLAGTPLGDSAVERLAGNRSVRKAVKALGTPVELTEQEKAKGYSAAFIGKDGTRMAIGVPRQIDLEEAIEERA